VTRREQPKGPQDAAEWRTRLLAKRDPIRSSSLETQFASEYRSDVCKALRPASTGSFATF
jgi:hypothetical protein